MLGLPWHKRRSSVVEAARALPVPSLADRAESLSRINLTIANLKDLSSHYCADEPIKVKLALDMAIADLRWVVKDLTKE